MTPRLSSSVLVSALIRQIESKGGTGAVLAKGDPVAGALLLVVADRGLVNAVRERGLRSDGTSGWIPAGPPDPGDVAALSAYTERRRKSDPDLWVVELDGIEPAQFDAVLASL